MANILSEVSDSFGHAYMVNDKYEDSSTYIMGLLNPVSHYFKVDYDVFTF